MKYRRLSFICLLAAFLVVALSANAFADAIDQDTPFGVNENGETYECAIKPQRASDKAILNMLIKALNA